MSYRHPILVVNAGSQSLKLSAVEADDSSREVESLEAAPAVAAVAHRVVHGGDRFREPVLIDDDVERAIGELTELAPLHNAPAVELIGKARRLLGDVPHVAVFDTAFHGTLPTVASTYAVPHRWREEWGIRRYGFHGLSVQWAAEQVPVSRLVVCHLGGGCSATAVLDGRSVDTTMGFSPLEGLPMATRAGSIDPEIVLHAQRRGLSAEAVEQALEHESGLLGLSGLSSRAEELLASDALAARLAIDVFAYRVATAVGALAVALDGLDALVFTGGLGEGSAPVRAQVCERLSFLGVELDAEANRTAQPDADIATIRSAVQVVVVRSREDAVAARAARELLGLPSPA